MAQKETFAKMLTSLADINQVLQTFSRPTPDELDKNAFKTILSGFRVIVACLEEDENGVDLEVPIQWMRLYLKVHMLISNSDAKLNYFSKSVPIAITYIIGLLKNAPTHDANFYTEVLNMSFKLVYLIDRSNLKTLEKCGKGIISLLWNVIDRVGQFNLQMQVFQLFILLLKDLDKDFSFWEIRNLPNVKSDKLVYEILDILRIRGDEDLFKKLARNILNEYNTQRSFEARVQSFYCKTIEIGESVRFSKPTYTNRFWFDINKNPHTLSFEGRIAPKSSRKFQNVSISLKIKEMFVDNDYIIVKYTPPAERFGIRFENEEFDRVDTARLAMCKTELARFVTIFNVPSKPAKYAGKVISVNDTTPNLKLIMSKNRSANLDSNFMTSTKSSDKSSDSLLRINISESPISFNLSTIEMPKQIQQVKPLSPICKGISKEAKNDLIILDEYEDINVSDAEPCQSYKNFQIRKSPKDNDTKPTRVLKPTKRSRQYVDLNDENPKLPKIQKEFNVLDYGPSTSKMAAKYIAPKKRSLIENAFDKLKSDTMTSKALYACKDKIVDITNDSSHFLTETPIDLTNSINSNETEKDIIYLKTPETKKSFEPRTSFSTTKKVLSASVTYEASQAVIPYEKRQENCLVYHKRSDSENSSDDSFSERCGTPKRKINNMRRSTTKKRLFDISHANVTNTDSDCDVTEFIYVGKRDYYKNMQKINTALSSFLQGSNLLPVFRGCKKNLPIFKNI